MPYLHHHNMYTYIKYICTAHIHICKPTLFHHTELISVLLHRWPSFTTLGKTNNEGGALSTTIIYIYTHIYVHTRTHIYILVFICTSTLFHHTELVSVLPHRWPSFTTLGKTNSEGGVLSNTIIYIYTHTYTYTHARTYTYIYIYL